MFKDIREALSKLFNQHLNIEEFRERYNADRILKEGKNSIVLNMEKTLVKTSFLALEHIDFFTSIFYFYEGKMIPMFVCIRPGLDKFLSELSKDYEIVVFSENIAPL